MRIIGNTQTPTGEPGILVECTCGTKHGTGRAIMRAVVREAVEANLELIHGHMILAHHPVLSRAPKVRLNGPWAV